MLEAEGIADADLGLWLRRKGLKEQHLREWRATLAERAQAVFAPRGPRPNAESRKRVKELERELKRKDKALAETAALLVLQGKKGLVGGRGRRHKAEQRRAVLENIAEAQASGARLSRCARVVGLSVRTIER